VWSIIEEPIIEGLRAGHSVMEIIRFFGYPRSTVYNVVAKYTALEQSNEGSNMPARKSHSKERTVSTPAVVERAQADFKSPVIQGNTLRILMDVVPWMETVTSERL